MKKVFVLLFAVAVFVSCKNKAPEPEVVAVETETLTVVPDEHNAKSSLDYAGVYKGVLPTASGSGMNVTIQLGDSTYTKEVQYVGKTDKPIQTKGVYKWNDAGNTITLENEDKPNQYSVGEGKLTQLDMDGNIIGGEIADQYILSK